MRRATNHRPPARRGGVTLTEVLMATMLMGIGVVTLATLFPISIMRSVRATQLTNATILRYNVESLIETDLRLVYDPDQDGNTNEHQGTNYVIDPMGYWRATAPALRPVFGNDAQGAVKGGVGRFNFGSGSLNEARDAVTLPDSWVRQVESYPTAQPTDAGGGEGQVVLDDLTTADLSGISTAATAPSRLVFFSADNKKSETRIIKDSGIAGLTLTFLGSVPSLNVARVVIETQEERYTWMLTVRNNSSGQANVDVVVYFRRSFGEEDEYVHDAQFRKNSNKVLINYLTVNKPYLRKGGFVLDVSNNVWYRIQDIENETSSSARLVLDRSAVDSSTGGGGAILPRGIVDVFPIGNK